MILIRKIFKFLITVLSAFFNLFYMKPNDSDFLKEDEKRKQMKIGKYDEKTEFFKNSLKE